jgi:hypothetical protein
MNNQRANAWIRRQARKPWIPSITTAASVAQPQAQATETAPRIPPGYAGSGTGQPPPTLTLTSQQISDRIRAAARRMVL